MVFVLDEGSEFGAPLEDVWAFTREHERHPHPSVSNSTVEWVGENTLVVSYDIRLSDRVLKIKYRSNILPPLGLTYEFLEGPFGGSKFFQYYIPKGRNNDKTEVVVVGHLVSPDLSDEDLLRRLFDEYMQRVFEEDSASMST